MFFHNILQAVDIVSYEEAIPGRVWSDGHFDATTYFRRNSFGFDLLFFCRHWYGMFWKIGII